jgi:hypothetical protein
MPYAVHFRRYLNLQQLPAVSAHIELSPRQSPSPRATCHFTSTFFSKSFSVSLSPCPLHVRVRAGVSIFLSAFGTPARRRGRPS